MSTIRPVLTDLSAGELSPSLAGCVNSPVYYKGCQEMTNWISRIIGGSRKRDGLAYVAETRASAWARIIPFVASATTIMILEFTDGYIRLFANDALVESSGATLLIESPYDIDDVPDLMYRQIHDTLIITHQDYPPWTLRFVSGTWSDGILSATFEYGTPSFVGNWLSWTAPTDTPWYCTDFWNKSAQWMTLNKVYAAQGTFNSKTLESAVRVSDSITLTFTDDTTLTLSQTDSYSYQGTIEIDFRICTEDGEYPAACGFKSGRLLLGGSNNEPNGYYASKPLDYFNFTFFEDVEYEETNEVEYVADFTVSGTRVSGSPYISMSASDITNMKRGYHLEGTGIPTGAKVKVVDKTNNRVQMTTNATASGTSTVTVSAWADPDITEYTYDTVITQQIGPGSAMKLLLATEEDETIQWIAEGDDVVIGTGSSEFAIAGNATAVDAAAALTGRLGSRRIQGRYVGKAIVFIQRSGKMLRAWSPDGSSPALNKHADHILISGVVAFDYQSDPETAIWCVGGDGNLYRAGLEGEMISWSRITTRTGDSFESVAVLPSDEGDLVYVVVKRTIGGSTKRFIERFAINNNTTFAERLHLDCATVKIEDEAFTSVSGLARFEGQTVVYYAGSSEATMVQGTATVSGGQINVPSCTCAYVGLLFKARLVPFRIETQETEGLKKRVNRIFFRLFRSGSFTLRYSDDDTRPTTPLTPEDPIYTGGIFASTANTNDSDQSLIIESESPWPVSILSIVPEIDVGGLATGRQ